jgi:hypothetical protein
MSTSRLTSAPALTNAQMLREISNALALVDAKIDGLEDTVNAKFAGIDREFTLIESRRVEQKIDTKVAVDAALSAAEKAVKEQTLASEKAIAKSEKSAADQSKQQNETFSAALKGVTDVLGDVKDRVVQIESRKDGSREAVIEHREASVENRDVWKTIAAVLTIVVMIAVATHGFTLP